MHDKRLFNRIPLSVPAQLVLGQERMAVQLEDISIQGVRLSLLANSEKRLTLSDDSSFIVSFRSNEDAPLITMQCVLSHCSLEQQNLAMMGCHIVAIDIDSFTSLRQLILHNVASPHMSEADVQALVEAIYAKASNASLS